MIFSNDTLEKRKGFLTTRLYEELRTKGSGVDPFTVTNDLPKAFRVGECHVIDPDRVKFNVLLFWKTDTRSEQRSIAVTAQKADGRWLLDEVGDATLF